VIPTLILFGILCGRWWRAALAAGFIGWPLLLLGTGTMGVEWGLLGAAALAFVNTLAGVLIHQAVLRAIRRARHGGSATDAPSSHPPATSR
jgi:hypothetical protein